MRRPPSNKPLARRLSRLRGVRPFGGAAFGVILGVMAIDDLQPGFPDAAEYPAFVAGYIGLTEGVTHPVVQMEQQGAAFAGWCEGLDAARRSYRYEPGKWSIQQMLGHITDTERVFAYRALRIARGDQSLNPPFEQDDWVVAAAHDDAPWADLVDEFRHVRGSTVLLLRHLPAGAWMKQGEVRGGAVTVRALAHAILGHLEHHRAVLRDRYL